jgi:hypothetical protein
MLIFPYWIELSHSFSFMSGHFDTYYKGFAYTPHEMMIAGPLEAQQNNIAHCVVVLLTCVVAAVCSEGKVGIVLDASMVGRLSDPSRTTAVFFPSRENSLEVLDVQRDRNHVTLVTKDISLTIEEAVARKGGKRRKRGVIVLTDSETDDAMASFEYVVDGDVVAETRSSPELQGEALLYATPTAKHAKLPPIGTVGFSCVGEGLAGKRGGDVVVYSMTFKLFPEHNVDGAVLRTDTVMVVRSTNANRSSEAGGLVASTLWTRWVPPMFLFAGIFGVLYAVRWWQSRSGMQSSRSTTSNEKKTD